MNCKLDTVTALIAGATALLLAAIALAYYWPTAYPLFGAAALVAAVSFGMIPAIKNALIAYAECRGASDKCSISYAINTLGQAASILSVVAFTVAALLQLTALAFISSWILALIGVAMEAAVAALVYSGIAACVATIGIFAGVLTNAYSYKSCMDAASQK
ncbi:MAG: hypothetical protein OEW15_04800 [Nitrospirota bacterium]|nr:hypothetical protein [Nitrospirota bacterium]